MTESTGAAADRRGWTTAAERAMPMARRVPVLRRIAAWRDAAVELQTVRPHRDHLVAHYESRVFVMPGHFYSPLPDIEDLERRRDEIFRAGRVPLPGIDLNEDGQLALLDELAPLGAGVYLPEGPTEGWRYYWDNVGFAGADAITLLTVLRHLQPRKYIEVGSGWSSALALDVNDRYLDGSMKMTFIDPYPEQLNALLHPSDQARVDIHALPVQAVDVTLFDQLGAGDVLFIDSTHVARTGGDVVHDVFEILPRLAAGVWVHFHDVFYPFEYPEPWVFEGRAWNEQYLLRALLTDSIRYRIALWPSMLATVQSDRVAKALPIWIPYGGGSIWLEVR